MSLKKEKKSFFETETFENTATAQEYLDKCNRTHTTNLILTGISIVSTVGIIIGNSSIMVFEILGLILLIIGYISALFVGRSFLFKFPVKLAKFCWYIVPIIPFDILAAVFGFLAGLLCLLYFPILLCVCGLIQSKRNCKAAEEFVTLNNTYQAEY